MIKVFAIGNGHGLGTAGKHSPDLSYREYLWTREIARMICETDQLDDLSDIKLVLLVPEEEDISLQERCNRVNKLCDEYGKDNVFYFSIHSNAAGMGQWMKARGWSVFTTPGATKSDKVASILYEKAEKLFTWPKAIRTEYSDGDPDYEKNFYVLRHTKCAAVLIENFFHDNKEDLEILQSEEGKNLCAQAVIDTIREVCVRQL